MLARSATRVVVLLLPALAWGCASPARAVPASSPLAAARALPPARRQRGIAAEVENYLAHAAVPHAPAGFACLAAVDESFDAAPVKVEAKRYRDEEPVGPYGQPGWTTRRRFTTTRAYVLPPGQIELEAWWRGTWPDEGAPKERVQGELGVGLGYRLQLDLYLNFEDPAGETIAWDGTAVEIRWALADWGKLFWNPTLYGEWKFVADGPDVYEIKALFSNDIAPRWRGAVNAIYEAEESGSKTTEIAVSGAVSYTLVDEKFYAGLEMKVNRVTDDGPSGAPEVEVLLGPSFQWRPTPRTHFDFVPLFGLTDESPLAQVFFVFGMDFGGGGDGRFSPTSVRSE